MILTSLMRIWLTRSFKPFIFYGIHQNKLDFELLDDLGLYVHIPFCRLLCSFCPYCKVVYDREEANAYKTALLKEIDLTCKDLKEPKLVTSLYFGGGTPALMIDDLQEIIERLKKYFIIDGGIGVELHPNDITLDNLKKLIAAGVNMVSIGIQSFDKNCLQKLGRKWEPFPEKLQMVRSQGFDVVDVDLIFAIPGQNDMILVEDMEMAFNNGATQVSTYPFIEFTFADNAYKPMPEKDKKRMLKTLSENCRKMSLDRTSVWTFAKHGTEKYSSVTRDTFLGFGVSATSLLQSIFKINTFSIENYIRRINENSLPTSLTLSFTKRQRAVYFMFWSAYTLKINPDKFEKIVGVPLNQMFRKEIFIAEKLGFLRKNDGIYELTDKAANVYHHIEQIYTTAYIDKMWNISRKQAFPARIILK